MTSINELQREFLLNNILDDPHGALPDMWMDFLIQEGYTTGSMQERLKKWLGDTGYTGPFSERWRDWMGQGEVYNSFSPMKLVMEEDSGDFEVLVIGDSMGDSQSEASGSWAAVLAARYPKYTVNWIAWNDAGNDYSAPTLVQTGTGSHTLNIYNACVGGTRTLYMLGTKYANAVEARNPGLIMFIHGLNHVGAGVFANMIRGEFLSALEEVRTTFPTANIAWVAENPKRDDTTMEAITEYSGASTTVSMLQILNREATIQPDITICDAYSKFIALGKASSLYTDATHGSTATGMALYTKAIMEKWNAAIPGAFAPGPRLMDTVGTNLVLNGDFASFASSPPTSWTEQNGVDATKEETNVFPGSPWACRLTGSATGAPNMRQILSAPNLALAKTEGYITIATRMFTPTGSAATVGRQNVFITGANTGVSSRAVTDGQGRYWWRFQPDIPVGSAASAIQILTYQDTSATPDQAHPVDVDRISVVLGRHPKNF